MEDIGEFFHSTAPVLVPGEQTFIQFSEGLPHSCGVTAEQTAYCRFDNGYGQLGSDDQVGSY